MPSLTPVTERQKAAVTSLAVRLPSPDTVKLTLALQTTLNIEEMVEIFAHEAREFVQFDGLVLHSRARGLELHSGTRGRHRCGYNLTVTEEALAEIEFTRNRQFGEADLASLEVLISAMIYPLRNALQYRDALRAAQRDPLTGIGNRLAFDTGIEHELHVARRYGQLLSLLAIDIDHFKRINDNYGHLMGDRVLRITAERIQSAIRGSDQAFRYGGEEFVALLVKTGIEGAELLAERIRKEMADVPIRCSGITIEVTVSIGVSALAEGDDAHDLFAKADLALYKAKNQGRNCVSLFHDGRTAGEA